VRLVAPSSRGHPFPEVSFAFAGGAPFMADLTIREVTDSAPHTMNLSAPSPGQLVMVRQRHYVVTGVVPSASPAESGVPDPTSRSSSRSRTRD